MFDFILKYWVQVFFGLLCLGMGAFFRLFWKLIKSEYAHQQAALLKSFDDKLTQQKDTLIEALNERDEKLLRADEKINADIEAMHESFAVLKSGMLSTQGRDFKEDCHKLLEPDHVISLNEFENITMEHDIYNSLGGNHDGDGLFELVKIKYLNTLNQ